MYFSSVKNKLHETNEAPSALAIEGTTVADIIYCIRHPKADFKLG